MKNSYQVDYENDHLLHHAPDTENIYEFFREIIEARFHFFKTNYDYLRISDWHKLEDIKEKMICIHTNKKNTIYSCLEKKISYFQNKKIITTIMTPQHILLVISATAFFAHEKINRDSLKNWIMIATADPSKFEKIISRSINIDLEPCNRLKELLSRKKHFFSIDPTMNDLKALYKQFFL